MNEAIIEHSANIIALEKMLDYMRDPQHEKTPALKDLGWVGHELERLFSNLYSRTPDFISAEIDILGSAAGGMAARAAHNPYFENPNVFNEMMETIEKGDIGIRIKDIPYLRTNDLLEIIANRNRS